jgi:hypothetical protein
MIKHLAVPVLGLAVLVGAAAPAAADRGRIFWSTPVYPYVYTDRSARYVVPPKSQKHYRSKGIPRLDFETEAVWRNLRPEWF